MQISRCRDLQPRIKKLPSFIDHEADLVANEAKSAFENPPNHSPSLIYK